MEGGSTLRDVLAVLRRRKWTVLGTLVLVSAVAVAVSVRQPKRYQASALVLLSWQNLANQLTGTSGSSVQQQPDRNAQTQAGVAQTTAVARRVLAKVPGTGLTPGGLLSQSGVTPSRNEDVLIFRVRNRDPALARRLVNEYATQYTVYRRELDTASITLARHNLAVALKRLEARGGGRTQLHNELAQQNQTLATMMALQTSNASVIQLAGGAAQIEPRRKRDAILAVVFGLILGLGVAYLRETLDTRVRDVEGIGKYLRGLPLLARVPVPSRRFRSGSRLVMMEEPDGAQAEPFRMFRTNLEFVRLDREIRTIMVTSAVEDEGKTITIANGAMALARSGQRVILVDLDLRRPSLDRLFGLSGPGVTDVALGRVALGEALVRIPLSDPLPQKNGGGDGYVNRSSSGTGYGTFEVLPAGALPPDRGAFCASQALTGVLELAAKRADVVLIDAPPVLRVGDAMTLSRKVDGIVVVTRINVVRRPMLQELARLLAMTPAHALGFVATGTSGGVAYGYEYGYGAPATVVPTAGSDDERGTARVKAGDLA